MPGSSSMFLLQHNFDNFVLYQVILSLFLGVILLWILFKWFSIQTLKKNLPPSPRRIPIFGNLHQLNSLPHRSLHSLAQKYGPVMLLHFGRVPTVIVSSADAASLVMKTHDLIFSDRPYSSIAARLLYNMKEIAASKYGKYWRQLKSIFVFQLLSNKKVKEFRCVREEEIALMVENIKGFSSSSSSINLSEMFMSISNDIICRSAFGRKYGEGKSGKKLRFLLSELLELLGNSYIGAFFPWMEWINRVNGVDARVARVAKGLDQIFDSVVQERLESGLRSSRGEANQSKHGEDFLDIMLRIHKDDSTGVAIDRDSVKAVLLDIFSAGTDTTATVPEWVMTELIRHPRVMKRLQNEVRETLNGKHNITDDDLEQMPYLKAVIKETLRLHPPIPLLVPREARQDIEIMGYHVAAGSMVMINAWAIGRDPATWDKPWEFFPERFLNSSIDYKGKDFQLIPFGAGRRGCPGIAFAMATNELILANLVHKFDWELPNGAKVEDLDMAERPGATIQRKNHLLALATPFSC